MIIAQLVEMGLFWASVYALSSVGFALILGVTRIFHIAHGSVLVCAAYTFYLFRVHFQFNFLLSGCFSVLVAAMLGLIIYQWIYRSMIKVGAHPMVLLIASFGILFVMTNAVALAFSTHHLSLGGFRLFGCSRFKVGFLGVPASHLLCVTSSFLILTGVMIFLGRTKAGRAMRAIADNPQMAQVVGIDQDRINLLSFVIGSALTAPAGIFLGLATSLEPGMGFQMVILSSVAVILGGVGSIPGAIMGALFLGLAMNLSTAMIASHWQTSIAFGLLVVVISIRPQGIWGRGM